MNVPPTPSAAAPSATARFDLTGRSALITGAAGALGRAAARVLAEAGASVTLASGDAEALERLQGELDAAPGETTIVARRPNTAADADAMVAAAVEATGQLDLVVCCAGTNHVAPTTEMTTENWQAVMDANVRGTWLVAQAAGRQMIDQGEGGKMVLVSSTRGKLGHPAGYSAYCPSKAAIDGLTKALACEWGAHSITVNAIAPTVFRSELTAWMYADDPKGAATREGMLARIPLGRLGEPEDFQGPLQFLLSAASGFVTGQVLYVDGGYTAG